MANSGGRLLAQYTDPLGPAPMRSAEKTGAVPEQVHAAAPKTRVGVEAADKLGACRSRSPGETTP